MDLKKYLLSPHKYKVLFYAEEKHEQDPRIMDFSNWVAIPPPNFIVTISPNPLVIREGQQQQDNASAIVQINSTTGRESEVVLESYFENNHYLNFEPSHMHIPSYGMGTSIVTITNSKSLRQGEIPIPIIINSSLLPEGIDVGNSINQLPSKSSVNNIMIPKYIPTENVIGQLYLIVKVVEPPPFSEQLKNWINDWFNPFAGIITPIVSAVSGNLGWKIGSSKNKDKRNTDAKETKQEENP